MNKAKFLGIVLASAAAVPQIVYAQQSGSAPADTAPTGTVTAEAGSARSALETATTDGDIVVTAQRRTENVLRVPLSVTVVSGDALRSNGVNDLSTVTKLAPSLQTGSDDTFSVRGIGTSTFAPTIESSVSQVVDQVVLGSPTFAANAFYDIERVEVLNGPQGLLFGKNASAGLINITTTRPQLGVYSAAFDVEATSRDRPGSDGQGVRVRTTLNFSGYR